MALFRRIPCRPYRQTRGRTTTRETAAGNVNRRATRHLTIENRGLRFLLLTRPPRLLANSPRQRVYPNGGGLAKRVEPPRNRTRLRQKFPRESVGHFRQSTRASVRRHIHALALSLLSSDFIRALLLNQIDKDDDNEFDEERFVLFPLFQSEVHVRCTVKLKTIFQRNRFRHTFSFHHFYRNRLTTRVKG